MSRAATAASAATEPAASPAAGEPAGRVFLKLSATYTIQPGASLADLLDDFRCLYESGLGAVETESDDFTHAQWAGCLALRQAGAVFDELERLARQHIEGVVSVAGQAAHELASRAKPPAKGRSLAAG